jgi:hypothetical protein
MESRRWELAEVLEAKPHALDLKSGILMQGCFVGFVEEFKEISNWALGLKIGPFLARF